MNRSEKRKTITNEEAQKMKEKFNELIEQNSLILMQNMNLHERLQKLEGETED